MSENRVNTTQAQELEWATLARIALADRETMMPRLRVRLFVRQGMKWSEKEVGRRSHVPLPHGHRSDICQLRHMWGTRAELGRGDGFLLFLPCRIGTLLSTTKRGNVPGAALARVRLKGQCKIPFVISPRGH
jgi:hypothetical protein